MHLHYPILPQGENPTPEELLKANEVYYGHCNYAGFWLLTTSNGFHGGIHIEEVNKPVHCMADGRIIAYRIGNENIKQKGNEALSFSNAFVLVQHNFTTNKGVSLRFYSLYMHLLPKAELEKDKGKNIPDWCVEHYTSIATNQKELGLRFRLYDEICLHKNNETVFLPKGAILDKADHVSIPDKHWAKNANYVLCCYKDKTYVVYKNYLDTYDTYYQISFKKAKDENTIDANVPKGAMLFDGIKGTYIGMECIGSDIEIEHTKTKDWYKIKAENKYILAVDCTPLKHRINHDVFKFDGNIHNVDIPIKAGAIVGMPSQYETNLSKNYTVVHLEVFTDDKNLETFINNQKDKDKTTYQAEKDQVLKAAAPCNFLKKDEKVKLFKTDGTYVQVGFENIEAVITYDERIAYDTATQSYAIKTFSKVNTEFDNTLPTDATHLYFDAYMKKNEDGSFDKCTKTFEENAIKKAKKEGKSYTKYRRLLFKHPKHAKKYWVNASEVTGEVGHWITLQNAITEYYKDQPNSTTSDQLITKPTKIRKITTAKDASGTEWWHVKTKAEKGWIKKESLTAKNPYMWKDFGWELIPDAGDQYFYMFGKYTDQKEPHPFAKRIIEMVDTNGDGEVSNYELQQAVRAKEKLEITSKLIAKHSSEWGMGDASAAFKEELVKVHEKGIRKATDPENKQELIKKRDAKIEQTLFRVQQLNFWNKLTNGDVTTKAQRKAAFFASKGVTPLNGTIPTGSGAADKAKRDQQLTEAFNALEAKRSPRQFPSDSTVWHFHPIAFVEQMKMITDTGWHEPVDNPMSTNYMQTISSISNLSKNWGLFGDTIRKEVNRKHVGLDLFAKTGTNIYACVDATVYHRCWHNGYGNTITIKVKDPKAFMALVRTDYKHKTSREMKQGKNWKDSGDIYLFYGHLDSIKEFSFGDEVRCGDILGTTGRSGVTGDGTRAPHLHFEIFCTYAKPSGTKYCINPAYFVNYKHYEEQSASERKLQEDESARKPINEENGKEKLVHFNNSTFQKK